MVQGLSMIAEDEQLTEASAHTFTNKRINVYEYYEVVHTYAVTTARIKSTKWHIESVSRRTYPYVPKNIGFLDESMVVPVKLTLNDAGEQVVNPAYLRCSLEYYHQVNSLMANGPLNYAKWFPYSGTTHHVTGTTSTFSSKQAYTGSGKDESTEVVLVEGKLDGGLYKFDGQTIQETAIVNNIVVKNANEYWLWHKRVFNTHKLDFQSKACVFLGYSSMHHGYQCMDEHDRIYVSRSVVFNENIFLFAHKAAAHNRGGNKVVRSRAIPVVISPHNQARTVSRPGVNTDVSTDQRLEASSVGQPATTNNELHHEQFVSSDNNTCDIVELPAGGKSICCKWLFKVKKSVDGSVKRLKARLVAKRQVDMNNVFLKGDLSEGVYMQHVTGFEEQSSDGAVLVCKLKKALYGLRQAPRNREEHEVVYMVVYVDDILFTGSSQLEIDQIIHALHEKFSLKDLGQLKYFLGIEVHRSDNGLFLNQKKFITELLQKNQMLNVNSASTPMETTTKLSKNDGYLRGILETGIWFSTQAQKLVVLNAFSNSDWGGDTDDRRSISGYCVYNGNHLLAWSSKKQHTISRSTAEADYKSLAYVTSEVVWIKVVLYEMKIVLSEEPKVWCDNINTVAMAVNPILHTKSKHIELYLHFVREKVATHEVQINYVPTSSHVADILTKPLPLVKFDLFRSKLYVF
ncbi:hypothetical protein F3Y22_tig00110860pilonHSYRG00117 [Hibiscus syriacus]|uniref:Reverse transcriptase Ty1/copia-type domain-containing protein n=1 Tax=Hibiscus syriacus TaxID=106335 RepID=A0A6A2ZJ76_HIBSY|nr:hypothetical protein F3Y22_tig00110860pilonHSYRG00117 [Hibiscus syriacus]